MGSSMSKKVVVFLVIVLLLIMALIYVYFISPARQELVERKEELVRKNEHAALLQSKIDEGLAMSDVDRIRLDVIRRRVPEMPYVELLLRDSRRLEVASHMQFFQYDINPGMPQVTAVANGSASTSAALVPEKAKDLIPITIETSFKGKYADIYQLFRELESLERLILVNSLKLHTEDQLSIDINNANRPINGSLSLVAYYSPGMKALVGPAIEVEYEKPAGRKNPF